MNRRPRWSLRLFMAFMLVTGCILGIFGQREMRKRRERLAAKKLASIGVMIGNKYRGNLSPAGAITTASVYDHYIRKDELKGDLNEELTCLSDLKHLRMLHFMNCSTISNATIRQLESLPALEDLRLSNFPVDDTVLASVAKISSLKNLWIENPHMTTEGIKHLSELKNLQTLDLGWSNRPAINLKGAGPYFAKMASLKVLLLPAEITGDDLQQFGKVPNLLNLNVFETSQLSAANIAGLANCRGLETLNLMHVNDDHGSMKGIGKLTSLSTFVGGPLSPGDVAELKKCTNLSSLSFSGINGDIDKTVEELKGLKHVEHLHFRFPDATEIRASPLFDNPNLQAIVLGFENDPMAPQPIGRKKPNQLQTENPGVRAFTRNAQNIFEERYRSEP